MSELYQLPNGWRWEVLDNLTEVNIGKTPSRSKSQYFLGDKVWLSIRDLKGDYVSDSNEKLTDEAIKDSNIKIIPKGTLLMSFKLTLGRTAFTECDLYTNEAIASLPIKDESVLDKYFLKYSIGVIDLEKEVDNAVKGKTLNKQKIKNLDIPVPPLSEQQRIVSKLDNLFEKIDKAIELHQQNIDGIDGFMASVLNEVFLELEGRYGVIKINNIVQETKNKTPKNNSETPFTYIDISSIDNKSFKIVAPKKLIGKEAPSRAKKEVIYGDIVYSTTRPNLKNISIIKEKYDNPIASTGFCVLRVNQKAINNYLFYYLITDKLFEQIEPNIRGSQYPATSDRFLKNCNIPNTPLNIQQKTVKYLDEVSQKIEKLKALQIEKKESLKALKSSLLDRAFRGEL